MKSDTRDSRNRGGRMILAAFLFGALALGLAAPSPAAADDCVALGGTLVPAAPPNECQISGPTTPKTGTFNLDETLHILSGGTLNVAPAGITINIAPVAPNTRADLVMENNSLIDGNVPSCQGADTGAAITVSLSNGNVNLKPGSIVRSNSCAGGFIQIIAAPPGTIDIDGLVESVGSNTGSSPKRPGGGPITIKAGCVLTITDQGKVSSRGGDPGADLVHLEGCVVTVFGLVESTGTGHQIPNTPANSCSDAPTVGPRRNPVTRPGKPQKSTACVEIWSGTTLLIDSTGSHKGEVNADVGFTGGPEGRGWIDLFANLDININDGAGNGQSRFPTPFAVHANGGLQQNSDDGGLITIKSLLGSVATTGNAIQADATGPNCGGCDGGEIVVEAKININFSGSAIFARGDTDSGGGFGNGGKIGPLATPIRAFTGFLSWTSGVGDARPTGSAVPAAQRGQITLQACAAAGGVTLGATFPVNGVVVLPYPNVLPSSCVGAPVLPAYATPFPSATCDTQCRLIPSGGKRGMKFNDLDGNHLKGGAEPGLQNWEIRVYDTANVQVNSQLTDAAGNYAFALNPGSHKVCEVLKPGWTQTCPTGVPPNGLDCNGAATTIADCDAIDPALAPLGYAITITTGLDEGNDFGNTFETPPCPEDPAAVCSCSVGPQFSTLDLAYHDPTCGFNGATICMFANTVENAKLDGDLTLKITQCTLARMTALDNNAPVVDVTSTGKLTIVGPDTVGGTIGWLVQSSGHELRGLRASGASQYGAWIKGNDNSVAFNTVSGSPVGIRIEGINNDVRGGTISGNSGDGVQVAGGPGNKMRGANVQQNSGNGIVVEGSGNTVRDNGRVNNNIKNGILVTGNGNTILNNATGSDKGKGNIENGIKVTGTGNTLDSNKANANTLHGFHITSTATGTRLKNNQSNQSPNGACGASSKENCQKEYQLDVGAVNLGGNKADQIGIPKVSAPQKCAVFPAPLACE